ncbi:MAG: hypothetical protein J0H08_17795, partial [Rhizobiales bacterium]|nr:hypothetical protein [Hyphomicrobiales bacterium]
FSAFVFDTASFESVGADPTDGPCLHFSGFALVGTEILSSAIELNERMAVGTIAPADLLSARGYFTAVVRHGSEVWFVNDLLGLEHVYVCEHPAGTVVANRLHLLIARMRLRGIERRVNLPFVATTLSSRHPFFSQCHAHEMAVAGVSLVPVDRYAVLRDGRLAYRPKPILAAAFAGDGGDYDVLVYRAADEILASVTAARRCGLFEHFAADLSGGRDSRVVFGAILRLGLLPATPILSRHVEGSRDLRCALRIAGHYGATLLGDEPDAPPIYPVDATAALHRWRSLYCGMYHTFNPSTSSSRGAGMRSLRFTGACGEIHTAFWSKWTARSLDAPTGEEALERLLGRFAPDLAPHYRANALQAFAECLLAVPGDTIGEKLDNHYLFFRNRMHFGLRAFHAYDAQSAWMPLVSPSLLLASRKIPWDQRRDGKVIFDVLARLAPELNFFPYEGKPWPDSVLARKAKNPGRSVDVDAVKAEWDAAEAARSRMFARQRAGRGGGFTHAELKAHARDVTVAAWKRISTELPEVAAALDDRFIDRTLRSFEDAEDDKSWRLATSKITSVADLLLEPLP